MRRVVITATARRDIVDLLACSEREYGENARRRYEHLVRSGVQALRSDPDRSGVSTHPSLRPGLRLFHLRHVRRDAPGSEGVERPRHLVAFLVDAQALTVLRVLHHRMDLLARLGDGERG